MKNNWLRYAATAAIAGGMLLGAQEVGSQTAPPAQQQHQRQHGARLAQYLNLTPAQIEQTKAEFQAVRQSAQPLHQQLKQVRAAMVQAIQANDTAKIDQLSSQEAGLKGQIAAMRHESAARLYSSLTPEQRAKADQLPQMFQGMRHRRMENRQNPANNNG